VFLLFVNWTISEDSRDICASFTVYKDLFTFYWLAY